MFHLHQLIETEASLKATQLIDGKYDQPAYPPGIHLTESETQALDELVGKKELGSALSKLFADQSSRILFDLFNIIDGTGDPDEGEWSEVVIIDRPEDYTENHEFLHEEFYSSYLDWQKSKNEN